MKLVNASKFVAVGLATMIAGAAIGSIPVYERATGGVLDLTWVAGFQTPQNMQALTLDASNPAYANPSGDHTVALAVNAELNSGGLIQTLTDPQGVSNYTWQGWVFTGDARTRRGLAVRASETPGTSTAYQFVIDEGLSQFRFRRASLVNQVPSVTNLRLWPVFNLPGFTLPNANEWHRMKVIAEGNQFRCFWNDYELTADANGPVVDSSFPTGWVGIYSFSATNPLVSVYFDDLELSVDGVVPARKQSWGEVKSLWR